MYVYIYICMYIYVCIYIYIFIYVCICLCVMGSGLLKCFAWNTISKENHGMAGLQGVVFDF